MLEVSQNMLGAYGEWAAGLVSDGPGSLSFRSEEWQDVDEWRTAARSKLLELMSGPDSGSTPEATIEREYVYDGLHIEELSWQLPYGPRTQAIFLKPEGAKGPLPGIVALHDHGDQKYFGKRKITQTSDQLHPILAEHQKLYYGGVAWANQIAKRGYAVLVPDLFAFGSRRVLQKDLPPQVANMLVDVCDEPGSEPPADTVDMKVESEDEIKTYNLFALQHEHLMAKSLLCAGTTWPGVFCGEDQRALDYLCSRYDVDDERVGCGGLSGGGLRTVFLAGLDDRIKCAITVGFMTTWRDFLLDKSYAHTWMIYVPLMAKYMDFPDIISLRTPLPTMVLCTRHDPLFTMPEMERSQAMLTETYAKAGAPDSFRFSFYDGPHIFDIPMQAEAFDWFNLWLKA